MSYEYCKAANDALTDAWNMFADTGDLHNGILRPDSYTSWIRCRHQLLAGPLFSLTQPEYEQRIARNRNLITNAQPVIDQLDDILKKVLGEGYAIILLDVDGFILETFCDNQNPVPIGSRYSEKQVCAKAMEISLREKKVVEVYGYENTYPQSQNWNTIGALILNHDKSIAGALGIVNQSENVASLIPILKISAQLIQSALVFVQTTINKTALLLEDIPEAVIAVNSLGVILNANREFIELLEVPKDLMIGQNISDYLLGDIDFKKLFSPYDKISVFNNISVQGRSKGTYTIVKKTIIDENYNYSLITLSFKKNVPRNLVSLLPRLNDNLHQFDDLIGETVPIKFVKSIARKAANSLFNVLIEGESGTGKELLAQAIHMSSRPQGPFIAINCGALTRELLQSELFGYEEGAFTGAVKGGKPGKFELADQGTIFLDEIGEMPLEMQVSLLRCLQDKTVTRVGGTHPRVVDIRIIAATNRNLYEQVKNGSFREDLYYRLNVIEINIPPLRERTDDIPLLCSHILNEVSQKLNLSEIELSPQALECLCHYHWPGNVRELQNILERAVIYADSRVIGCECLPLAVRESFPMINDVNGSLKEFERLVIIEAVAKYHGNISKSAAELGIARSTLYQKMDRMGISPRALRR